MTEKFLSCHGFGLSPTQMLFGLLPSYSKLPDGFPFTEHDTIFTYQGRYAIYLICQILHIGKDDEVIVPSYNCGAEVDPFVYAGAKVIFYKVDNKAVIDITDIKSLVTPSTKLIYVTHFFGWPQEIVDLAIWCKERNIFLVEDCAQALFSKGSNNTIGRVGDAVIYSLVKSLPVPDGGALVLRNKDLLNETIISRLPPYRNTLRTSLPLLKHWFMNKSELWQHHELTRRLLSKSWSRSHINQNNNCEIRRDLPKSNYVDGQKIDWSISRLSKGILSKTNPERIFKIRRRNYQHLHNTLCNMSSIQLLFDDLPNDVCPLSFPIFVKKRNHWCNILEKDNGILVGGWPSYHQDFDLMKFPEARHLKDDIITLPVHQDLELQHMEYISECAKLIAEKNDNCNS